MSQDLPQKSNAAAGEDVPFSLSEDHEELRHRLAESSVANGWDEPGMEAYDSYPAKR